MWRDRRVIDLFKIEHPILLAPMAGAGDVQLAIAVARGGGLGAIPCAMLTADQLRKQLETFRAAVRAPVNVNFFCHIPPQLNNAREARWRDRLRPYYEEFGIDPAAPVPTSNRSPFDDGFCSVVEELKPEIVSFHFGLPAVPLLKRVKAAGCRVIGCATTVAEARWLEQQGVDAVIAQGFEAGGHRGMFLTDDLAGQVGTFALVPQIADAVTVPVIATGSVGDARGIVAAFALGAAAVQLGTAYLKCPESIITPLHRAALREARDDSTAMTNVMTGRPARGLVNRVMCEVGPISDVPPAFPLAAGALMPLRVKAEAQGSSAFSPMLAGEAAALGPVLPADELTRTLATAALAKLATSL